MGRGVPGARWINVRRRHAGRVIREVIRTEVMERAIAEAGGRNKPPGLFPPFSWCHRDPQAATLADNVQGHGLADHLGPQGAEQIIQTGQGLA